MSVPSYPGQAGARRQVIAGRLVAATAVVSGGLGLYHLTHNGAGSGVTELAFAAILIFLKYLSSDASPHRTAARAVIGAIAATLFSLSIYHATHQGLPSFALELGMAVTLGAALLLLANSRKK